MTTSLMQPTFSRGEIGPEIAARTDLAAYQTGLAKCLNFIVSPYGGVMNRPGTQFIAQTPNNEIARLIRFKFNARDTYALEFTHLKMRIYRNGGLVLYSSGPNAGQVFELATPFTRDEISTVNFVQSADVMDMVHVNHKPQKLKRFAHDNWTIAPVSLVPALAAPASVTAVRDGGGDSTTTLPWRYQVTAVRDDGSQTPEESLPATSNQINVRSDARIATVSWTAVPTADYYEIYKDDTGAGVYGFIGRATSLSLVDNNIAPTKTDTPPTGEDPFTGTGNYPRAVTYFQQRLVYGGTLNRPQTLYFSRTGVFTNFGYSFPTKDDDAITWTMASNEVNSINHLVPLRSLMTFTDGAEWIIQGQASGFTAKTINGDPQTYNGIGDLRPLVLNNTAIYAQERGRTVTAFGYSIESDGFTGNDISILSPQMLNEYGLVDWDYQQIPYSLVWGAREDGQMVGVTYLAEQQVIAWHRHVTNGKVLSVCSVPEGRSDAVYLCVERRINGVMRRYVERMADRQLPRQDGQPLINYSWFLDCALRYDGYNLGTETMTVTGGTTWKYPELLTIGSSNSSRFSATDVGDQVQYLARTGTEPFRFEITQFISGGVVKARPIGEVPVEIRTAPFTSWAIGRDTLSGLEHLEGERVNVLADGNVITGVRVTDGKIDIGSPAGVVLAGLPYECEIQTLQFTDPGGETVVDKHKIIKSVAVVVLESRGGWYGSGPDEMWEWKPRQQSDEYGAIQPYSGDIEQLITSKWSDTGQVTIQQRDPLPLQILAVIPRVDVGGRKG